MSVPYLGGHGHDVRAGSVREALEINIETSATSDMRQ
jgi:hypothetical protein